MSCDFSERDFRMFVVETCRGKNTNHTGLGVFSAVDYFPNELL